MKQKLLLVAALFFGILAFILTYYQRKSEIERLRGSAKTYYFVKIKKDMLEGEPIGRSDVESVKDIRQTNAKIIEVQWSEVESIIGRKLSRSVRKGEVLTVYDLQLEGGARVGLAGLIPMDYRAISIAVDATSSVTGLVKPGDIVDIIGTFKFPEMKSDKGLDTITLTLLQGVVVLATGTELKNVRSAEGGKKSYSTVTLQLTPDEAEMIVFASQKGRLTLSLRNPDETKIVKDLQSVNFKYLEENIQKWNEKRDKAAKEGRSSRMSR